MADDEELPPQPVGANTANEGPELKRQWEGPFNEDGLPHGQGKMTYPPPPQGEDEEEEKPGDTFEGTMVAGVRHGPGKYVWSSGAFFEGTYENNIREGKGYMVYPNKCTYKGDFANNVPHGVGLYGYSNGDMYMGQWKEGKRHGNGSYHFKKEGCQFIGEWADGSFVAGQWTFKDGTTFKGSFADFKPQGEGELTLARSRLRQEGAFVNGQWKGGPDIVVLPMLA